ncbi:MAG: hypothetical protein WCE83_00955 [Candidatus Baltobacteraceae bacterium]
MRTKVFFLSACALAAAGLAGCGASGGGQAPNVPNQQNLSSNVLQLAVGTANIAGQTGPGLNVVVTYRQPNGKSGSTLSSPTFSGPFVLAGPQGSLGADGFFDTIESGPAPTELGKSAMTSTAQTDTTGTTFGVSGGAVALGIEPFNYNENGVPDSVAPYVLPLYDSVANDPNTFVSWGGPPAFDLLGNGQSPVGSGNVPGGTAGISEGLDVFAGVVPVVGTYTLALSIPTNNGTFNTSQTASLASTTLLPAIAAPTLVSADGNGGATFNVTLPAGVTEAFLQITDIGPATGASCNGGGVYYTILVTASGTATLPDNVGPGGAPSLCTPAQNTAFSANVPANNGATVNTDGDQFSAQLIGFDYDEYSLELHNAAAVKPAPALPAKADVTISTKGLHTWAYGTAQPVSKLRR